MSLTAQQGPPPARVVTTRLLVGIAVGVEVMVGVLVGVGVGLLVAVEVTVGVGLSVAVEEAVGEMVLVGVLVSVEVWVPVSELVAVEDMVGVGVTVGLFVGVLVGVRVVVGVTVGVPGVGVMVLVAVTRMMIVTGAEGVVGPLPQDHCRLIPHTGIIKNRSQAKGYFLNENFNIFPF